MKFCPECKTAITLQDILACESCIPDVETLLLQNAARWLDVLRRRETTVVADAFRSRDCHPAAEPNGRGLPEPAA